MRINTNVQAINAYRQLTISYGNVSKNIEKLSSGLRINRAGDDAAGLAISEKMRSQIRGLNMAERNTLDGISLIQTAEGALQEVHNALQRMRELSIQSANGTLASDDRIAIQNEIDQLTFDIDRIAKTTQFNANPLLRGSLLSRSVITTNSPEIKYDKAGTWKGDIVADPSERGEVELRLTGTIADGESLEINGKRYEFRNPANPNPVQAGSIEVIRGASVQNSLENLMNVVKDNDNTFDASASTITGTSPNVTLSLKTTKNMSPAEAGKITVNSANISNGDFFNSTGAVTTVMEAPGTSTNLKTVYLNLTETPKKGDKLIIGSGTDGITIDFDNTSIAYSGGTGVAGTATVAINNKSAYDVINEVFSVITSAKNDNKIPSLADFKINGNSLILTTDKTDDGAQNGLQVEFKDNDFETHAGKDMQINLQIGANDSERMTLLIGVIDSAFLGIARKADYKEVISTAGVDAEAGVSVLTEEDANNAITFFDNAIRLVSESRSRLGAYQNRLEHTLANVTTAAENLTAAESRIRDVDMALEMSEYTKNNIINQAATAMLAQANMIPQGVLQLLQ